MKILILVMTFVLVCRGVNADSIDENFYKINYEDGVNFEEAKIIAQKFLLQHKNRDAFNISAVGEYGLGDRPDDPEWPLYFPTNISEPSSEFYQTIFIIAINKSNGRVRMYHIYKWQDRSIELKDYGEEGYTVK